MKNRAYLGNSFPEKLETKITEYYFNNLARKLPIQFMTNLRT